ncbi:hypothetical protein ACVWY0_002707 [Arthrobacter sp. UYNi723]
MPADASMRMRERFSGKLGAGRRTLRTGMMPLPLIVLGLLGGVGMHTVGLDNEQVPSDPNTLGSCGGHVPAGDKPAVLFFHGGALLCGQ